MEKKESTSSEMITRPTFLKLLSRYDTIIEGLSKQGKPNTQTLTLSELDQWRLNELPSIIQQRKQESSQEAWLEKDEVEKLIQWKLKHGTFRPRLMKLVESNSAEDIKNVTRDAFQIYNKSWTADGPQESLGWLCSLKGIGPASASLLLSVYDPLNVPFFSDECFRWVMDGVDDRWNGEIKYDFKSYDKFFDEVVDLRARLKDGNEYVSACDVEKVGFVVGKEMAAGGNKGKGAASKQKEEKGESSSVKKRARDGDTQEGDSIASRTRRSKRLNDV
ncbi:MAG: hypothetical protein M1823_005457 [Watsoniomyces obsoletus]|nr:MAG: hypothetical protein M1823_005457 [Watsoniomyces obsoletus]